MCHRATFQLLYVSLCNTTSGLIYVICILQYLKKKKKEFGFHCHFSRTKPQKLVPNLTSSWTATTLDAWVKWVFNLFTLSVFMLRFAAALLNFNMLVRLHETWQTELSLYQIAKQITKNCREGRTGHRSLHCEQYYSSISWHQTFKACVLSYMSIQFLFGCIPA